MSEPGRVITYGDAGVEALREEMRRNDEHCVYRARHRSAGRKLSANPRAVEKFGDDRLRDTGICELGATGRDWRRYGWHAHRGR